MSVVLDEIDIKWNFLFHLDENLLKILLKDHSSGNNIIWATNDYKIYGEHFGANDYITIDLITGENEGIIKPRVQKTKNAKVVRIREKAEVFTPSWICNAQNNLIDNDWFQSSKIFNKETEKGWITNNKKVVFPMNKTWKDYVTSTRCEIACGEAPYLTSRYDVVTGEYIEPKNRIGILDRKLRIISENVSGEKEWIDWTKIAVKNIYGYDWQGDNVLLSRKNVLYAIIEYYEYVYSKKLSTKVLKDLAEIISWNIWQMDGLKCVIPNSCKTNHKKQSSTTKTKEKCQGCRENNIHRHKGIYCKIMNWDKNIPVKFVSLLKG